jgi:hypothetical protein
VGLDHGIQQNLSAYVLQEQWLEIYAPDYVNHTTVAGGDLHGLDGVRRVMNAFRTGSQM